MNLLSLLLFISEFEDLIFDELRHSESDYITLFRKLKIATLVNNKKCKNYIITLLKIEASNKIRIVNQFREFNNRKAVIFLTILMKY